MCRLDFGNPFTISCSDLSRKQRPILYDLCASFLTSRQRQRADMFYRLLEKITSTHLFSTIICLNVN